MPVHQGIRNYLDHQEPNSRLDIYFISGKAKEYLIKRLISTLWIDPWTDFPLREEARETYGYIKEWELNQLTRRLA